jgi:hypothetical protein
MHNLIVAATAATQQLFSSFLIIFHDVPTKYDKKASKKHLRELTPYKRNVIYSEKMLLLAIHAAVRLHNYILSTENLSYAAYKSPEMESSANF